VGGVVLLTGATGFLGAQVARRLVEMMVKLADEPGGWVAGSRVHKTLTGLDQRRLTDGVALATEILGRFGAAPEDVVLGAVNAGHPGGMLPLTRDSAASFHHARLPATSMRPTPACSPRSATRRSSPSSPWPNASGDCSVMASLPGNRPPPV
jgi:hypothetical protein